ncbi:MULTISPECIES: DUF4326 domain-containing protein [Nocardia]|uniref:DUF4326 domain-containing protein n=1 Tax=Nocardia sputorum TaxID=2984338 RepID=A0ABM8D0Z0_9NOCA|nr:DUF4326 domain-containing protein [Nocardia sputorum]BDU00991.1 hypothetical protein IFM12276_40190 [Nocardia sputorum]
MVHYIDPVQLDTTELQQHLAAGTPVVVSIRAEAGHTHLIDWARRHNLFVRIDRASDWGNPYIIGRHGNRDDVITAHAHHIPRRVDLLTRLRRGALAGHVLGCWSAPKPCHGHTLSALSLDPDLDPLAAVRIQQRRRT